MAGAENLRLTRTGGDCIFMKKIWLSLVILLTCTALVSINSVLYAEIEIQNASKIFDKVTIGGEVSAFYRYTDNPLFGGEKVAYGYTPNKGYGETFSRIRLTAEKKIGIGETNHKKQWKKWKKFAR